MVHVTLSYTDRYWGIAASELLALAAKLCHSRRISINPAKLVKRQTENNSKVRYSLVEEEDRLRGVILERCPHHLPELEISLHTGMRLSEQYNLQWGWIDFGRR